MEHLHSKCNVSSIVTAKKAVMACAHLCTAALDNRQRVLRSGWVEMTDVHAP